jgi:hypothetical protein
MRASPHHLPGQVAFRRFKATPRLVHDINQQVKGTYPALKQI